MGRARLNGQSGGAKINGIIKEYVVKSGENISAGDFVKFVREISPQNVQKILTSVNASGYIDAVILTDTTVMIAYALASGSYGYACAVRFVNGVVEVLTPTATAFEPTNSISGGIGIKRINNTDAIVYWKTSVPNCRIAVVRLSGSSITCGTVLTAMSGASAWWGNMIQINATQFLEFYVDSSYYLKCRVNTVSNLTIAVGTGYQVNYNSSGIALSTQCFPRIFADGSIGIVFSAGNIVYIVFVTVSGTTVSLQKNAVALTGNISTSAQACCFLSDSLAIAHYAYNGKHSLVIIDINASHDATTRRTDEIITSSTISAFINLLPIADTKLLLSFSTSYPYYRYYAIIDLGAETARIESLFQTRTINCLAIAPPIELLHNSFVDCVIDGNYKLSLQLVNVLEYAKKALTAELIEGVAKKGGVSLEITKVYTIEGGL